MPNWCYNRLIVEGPAHIQQVFRDDLAAYMDKNGGQLSIARMILPMPEALEGTSSPTPTSPDPHPNWINLLESGEITQAWFDELCEGNRNRFESGVRARAATGFSDWYEWACAVWGTKWGDVDVNLESDVTNADTIISYNTAWGPLDPHVISKLAMKYWGLSFIVTSTEEGHAFVCAVGALRDQVETADAEPPSFYDENNPDDEEAWERLSWWENDWVDTTYDEMLSLLTGDKNDIVSVGTGH